MTYRRLVPGVYTDDAGELHVDSVEFCIAQGWDPTRENQDKAGDLVARILDDLREAEGLEPAERETRHGPPPFKGFG
jgi:hypothetical protein